MLQGGNHDIKAVFDLSKLYDSDLLAASFVAGPQGYSVVAKGIQTKLGMVTNCSGSVRKSKLSMIREDVLYLM